jgi:predicted flap endonuclease-1-like 5' DNA nuclease
MTILFPQTNGQAWPDAERAIQAWWSAWAPGASSFAAIGEIGRLQLRLFEDMTRLMLQPLEPAPAKDIASQPAAVVEADVEGVAPALFDAPRSAPDDLPRALGPGPANAIAAQPASVVEADVEGVAPPLFDAPRGAPDDLLLIKGVGPKLRQLLNSLGIWHYSQIVSWTPSEVAWVNAKIDFKGRIQREGWQAQAAELIAAAKAA